MRSGLLAAAIIGAATLLGAGSASADEAYVGVFAHDIKLWKSECCFEGGADVQFGWRGEKLQAMERFGNFRLYAMGSVNTDGGTDFASFGLMRRFWADSTKGYAQISIGLAVHDGPNERYQKTPDRIYFGSPVLFQSEATVGYHLNPDWAAEVSYVHLSHAGLGGDQNPGLDVVGARLVRKF